MIRRFAGFKRLERISDYIRKIYIALSLVLFTLLFGILGFILVEGYSFTEAFYMAIITLSTVGFSEVRELSSAGRVFTSVLIIFNIGIFAYSVSSIASFVIEGDFRKLLKDYKVLKTIDTLRNHVIVCGYGRHGKQVIAELKKHNEVFVVIENDPIRIAALRDANILFLEGDGTRDEILEEVGIIYASSLVVTFGDDAENVFVVLTARQINPKLRIISRAMSSKSEKKLIRAGADHVIMPERIGGFYMATLVHKPEVVDFFNILTDMAGANVIFEELPLSEVKVEFHNKTIADLKIREKTGANIIAIKKADDLYIVNPAPDTTLFGNMMLVALGDRPQINAFNKLYSIRKN